jgi:hypothetical protein
MNPILASGAAAASGFGVLLLLHALVLRLFVPASKYRILHQGFLVILPGVLSLAYLHLGNPDPGTFGPIGVALTVAGFLFGGTLAFYAAVEHSVRIRLFVELHRNDNRPMSMDGILESYDPRSATVHRLNQLVLAGYLKRTGERYELTSKGLLFARIGLHGKNFFKLAARSDVG